MTHFADAEFACRCQQPGCNAPAAPHRLLRLHLDRARDMLGAPIVVTSGNRCAEHNRLEGGGTPSEHVWPDGCLGCDIEVNGSRHRAQLRTALQRSGFSRVGTYRKHFHVGIGDIVSPANFPPEVDWVAP